MPSDPEMSMPPELARSSAFSLSLPLFQIAWDSTSLGLLKECPRKYQYEIVLGWHGKGENVHLKFGQLYHAGCEAYDHFCASIGKLGGGLTDEEHQEGIRTCLRHVFKLSAQKLPDGSFQGWRSTDPYKNLWTLCRSLVLYHDHFRNSPLRTVTLSNGKPAVELSFAFQGGEVNGQPFYWCGHLDRVVEDVAEPNKKMVHDRKTSKAQLNARWFQGFSPHNQFTLYTMASLVHYQQPTYGITVDGVQVQVNSSLFARQFIPFPEPVINEWLVEANYYINQAYAFAEAGFWPKNDKSCGNYGGCVFQKVCSKSPSFRQNWLEADFAPRRWNPLEVRGDI
jgi:hypothetical protein